MKLIIFVISLFCSLSTELSVHKIPVINLTPVVTDTNQWHTYPPGSTFSVQVSVLGTLPATSIMIKWVDEYKNMISGPFVVTNLPISITSPSTLPGWYGLIFTCADTQVAFVPQDAGYPSDVFGFAIIPSPPTGVISTIAKESCPFGMIQGNINDQYFRHGSGEKITGIHLKTKTWEQNAGSTWTNEINNIMHSGHTEMPLINNLSWESIDTTPISQSQLNSIGAQFQPRLVAEPNLVRYWQAGLEENAGSPYGTSNYFSNLIAKVTKLRQIANITPPTGITMEREAIDPYKWIKFVYNTRSFNTSEFNQLFASQIWNHYDVLAQNPYRWNNFEMPESWMASHINFLRNGLDSQGHSNIKLWFGELGLPARGRSNPSAFFGYPSTSINLPGVTLDHYANYVVKTHMIALASGVKRIYWYNYRNLYTNIQEAEAWFGMRSYISGQPGFPYPGYVAYITMLRHLKTSSFVKQRTPAPNIYVFEFQAENLIDRRLVVWYDSSGSIVVPLNSIRSGLIPSGVQSVESIYGRTVPSVIGQNITLSSKPLFIRF